MKKYSIIGFFLLLGNLAFSQVDTIRSSKQHLGIRFGYNHGYLKDLNFSPLNYTEGGLIYSLNYMHQSENTKSIFNAAMEFASLSLDSKASAYFESNLTLANIEIAYVRQVMRNKGISLYLGGQYSSYLHIVDWQYYESFSYLASHGLGMKGLFLYELSSTHRFSSSLFLPVFQFLARPPYNGLNEEIIENQDAIGKIILNGKPSSFKHYLAFDWKINYLFSLSKRVDLSATYLLRYQHLPEINKVSHLQNQFFLGANIKF